MANQKTNQKINPGYFSLSFEVQGTDEAGKPVRVAETTSFHFSDQQQMNSQLRNKEWLLEVIPLVLNRVNDEHDPEMSASKALLAKLGMEKENQNPI